MSGSGVRLARLPRLERLRLPVTKIVDDHREGTPETDQRAQKNERKDSDSMGALSNSAQHRNKVTGTVHRDREIERRKNN